MIFNVVAAAAGAVARGVSDMDRQPRPVIERVREENLNVNLAFRRRVLNQSWSKPK